MPITTQNALDLKRKKNSNRAFLISYLMASAVVLLAYSSLFRPLWIDEAIHFVLSGQPSFSDLLLRLHNPDAGFLTRQTGFYQVINFLTLQVTGADWVALRLPSIGCGALLIWAMYVFLRERGLPRSWQFIGLGLLAGQSGLMYFVGEARPYLPYAATTLGMLAFFTASDSARSSKSIKILGCLSLYLGALFHLYFLLVLPIVLIFSIWYRHFSQVQNLSLHSLDRALHPRLVGGAILLAIVLGWLTWMRPQDTNQLDPFAWTGGSLSTLSDTVLNFHLEFLPASALRTSFLIVEATVFFFLLATRRYRQHRELFSSAVLVVLAFMVSAVISLSSIANHYAIANRQLVVGPLFIVVACVWQLFVVARALRDLKVAPRDVYLGGTIGLLFGGFLLLFNGSFPQFPLTLITILTIAGAACFCRERFIRYSHWRARIAIAALVAAGVIITSLTVVTRVPPKWQICVAMALGALLLLVFRFWPSAGRPLTMSAVFTAIVVAGTVMAATATLDARATVVKNEYADKSSLESVITSLGPDGVSKLQQVDIDDLQAETEYGPAWVYFSNINALGGGPVWTVLGDL